MPVPSSVEIKHYRGDSFGLKYVLWADKEKTQPVSLTGTTVTAAMKVDRKDTDSVDSFTVNTSNNEITLTLSPAKCRALPDKVVFDVQVDWQSNGVTVTTIGQGSLTLDMDVTP